MCFMCVSIYSITASISAKSWICPWSSYTIVLLSRYFFCLMCWLLGKKKTVTMSLVPKVMKILVPNWLLNHFYRSQISYTVAKYKCQGGCTNERATERERERHTLHITCSGTQISGYVCWTIANVILATVWGTTAM